MPIRVNEAVKAINAAMNNSTISVYFDQSADGLGYEVKNWSTLWPALECFLDLSWFSDRDWVKELIDQNRDQPILKMSTDRVNQLQKLVASIDTQIPVVLEAWTAVVDPKSDEAFYISSQLQALSDLGELASRLDEIFKLLAVDNAFTMTISEGFILVVPEGPYSHFCATFALYLATKTAQLIQGPSGSSSKSVIRFLPGYLEASETTESAIEEAIEKWAAEQLSEDWKWFESACREHFPDQTNNNVRNNVERALPLICKLLEEGNCHIDPPAFMTEQASSEGIRPLYGKLAGATKTAAQALRASVEGSKAALEAYPLVQSLVEKI